jgi:hypothetical protein
MLARQVLCHLSLSPLSLFCSGYSGDRVFLFAQFAMDGDPPGMTGTHHHAYFSSTEIESYKLFA